MGIVDDDIVKVREASDIVAIISAHLALKKVGTRFVGLCPFHGEKTPSFSVNPQLGLYYCFGCQAKGDAITFVREMDQLDFVGAVEYLAGRAGIQLRYTDKDQGAARKRKAELLDAVEAAVEWYHQRLLGSTDAAEARAYLRSRGFDGELVRRYRLGWAPDAWDQMVKALKRKKLADQVLIDAGLAFVNKANRLTDQFRGRVLFPIFDERGDALGFGGRIMPGGEGPKYKNSPESKVYAKSKVLYGLNWHKKAIVAADEVVVCEGYTDVIGFAQAGIDRSAATCGTALTHDHVKLLQRFARRVVLAFDADAAGQAAAERFYEWERTYEIDVAVADLPAGVDPGELAQRDPERLAAAVTGAKPFLAFRVDRVLTNASLDTPEGRARAAEAAMAVIAEHPSDLVKDQYVMEVADRCRVDADRLRATGTAEGAASSRSRPEPSRRDAARSLINNVRHDEAEREALRSAIHEPAAVAAYLDELLFNDEIALSAYRALAGAQTFHDALDAADPAASELLQQLAVEEVGEDPTDGVIKLIDDAVRRQLAGLEAEARQSDDPLQFATVMGDAKRQIGQLWEPETALDAAGGLLAWLQTGAEEAK